MSQETQLLQEEPPPDLDIESLNRKDPFLIVCYFFSVLTAVSATLCVVVNVFSAVYAFKNGQDIFNGILRCYAVLIALFVAVAETEWERILGFWRILEYWAGRGMLQVFVAVMTRALANQKSENGVLILLQEVSSYLLLACGVVYIVMGILCMRALKQSRQKKAISREQAAKEFEELEKRRKELTKVLSRRQGV